ncbi:putative Late nodulin [Medicago truncatula]|uniref:Putative Late nodulin n=1 Tax=Medicago truncatula TaxID=3880 RepID=A0A396GSK0_MEDTR|nr:putative Late nodulin [Medicago truncatula]
MHRAKNMAETLKFVYVLILFISIFLVIVVCDSAFLPRSRTCITDKDCLQVRNYIARCRKGICQQRPRR